MNEIPIRVARKWADQIIAELKPFCVQIEVAGSIRRGCELVHDIDIVAMCNDVDGYKRRMLERCRLIDNGKLNFIVAMDNGIHIDTFFARPRVSDLFGIRPTNWGSILLCRTGSKHHNVWIAQQARAQGMEWRTYHGLFKDRECIASESEGDIFHALGLSYIEPKRRER